MLAGFAPAEHEQADQQAQSTQDPQALERCDEICEAIIDFAFTNTYIPLPPQGVGVPPRPSDHRPSDPDRAA